jgi:hypothetical protein
MKRIFFMFIVATLAAMNASAQVSDSQTDSSNKVSADSLIRSQNMDIIVDISTILIGIMTVVTGVVSINIMRSQDKRQEETLQAQKREHQPNFQIKFIRSKSTPTSTVYDVEDFTIENIGEAMLARDRITVRSFIKVELRDITAGVNKSAYYPLTYYFFGTSSTANMQGLLLSTAQINLFNNKNFGDLNAAAIAHNASSANAKITVNMVHVFEFSYVDLYEEKRTVYYENGCRTTKERYDEIKNSAPGFMMSKSIENVTFNDLHKFITTI